MSTVAISYSSLKNASSEAKSVSKKMNAYADSLYSSVYKKLNNYDGSSSYNITSAKNKTNSKIEELRSKQTSYENYASDLSNLLDECKSVDKAVKSRVSELTASFKESHGIRDSKIENVISYFCTSITNDNAFTRWISSLNDSFSQGLDWIKSAIKEWYNFDGGKELIKGVLVGVLEVAIGVVSLILAVITGGAWLVVVCGVLAATIAIVNGVANIVFEVTAYGMASNDPATSRRLSDVNTLQEYLRSSFIYGFDGENYEYNPLYYGIALGIDIVNTVCAIVKFFSSGWKVIKNGYKWVTGNLSKVSSTAFKDIVSKDTGILSKGKDILCALKQGGLNIAKDYILTLKADILINLKDQFDFMGAATTKDGLTALKNVLSFGKDLVNAESMGEIFSALGENIIPAAFTLFKIETVESLNGINVSTWETFTWDDACFSLIDKFTKITGGIEGISLDTVDIGSVTSAIDGISVRGLTGISAYDAFSLALPDLDFGAINIGAMAVPQVAISGVSAETLNSVQILETIEIVPIFEVLTNVPVTTCGGSISMPDIKINLDVMMKAAGTGAAA